MSSDRSSRAQLVTQFRKHASILTSPFSKRQFYSLVDSFTVSCAKSKSIVLLLYGWKSGQPQGAWEAFRSS